MDARQMLVQRVARRIFDASLTDKPAVSFFVLPHKTEETALILKNEVTDLIYGWCGLAVSVSGSYYEGRVDAQVLRG